MQDSSKTKEELLEELRALRRANAALDSVIKDKERSEDILHSLIESTSSVAGTEFLRSLVRNLASALKLRYALVGELTGGGRSVRTLALWAGEGFAENFEYALKDTPCEEVVGRETCVYPKGVAKLFPKDHLLTEMGVEGYIGVPLFDAGGRPLGILVGLNDSPIEGSHARAVMSVFAQRASLELARKKAEDERRKSDEMLSAIIDNSMAVIYMKDPDGRFTVMNRWYERQFKTGREELIGLTDHDIFPADVAKRLRDNDARVLAGGVPVSFEEEVLEPDGRMHTYISVKFPIPGIPGAICGISTDITERKRAEEESRKSAERLKEAQQIARIGNWEWDIVSNTLFWSDEIYRIFGLEPNAFGATYEAFLNLVHPDDRDFVVDSVNGALHERAPYSIDHRIALRDGSIRTVHEQGRVDFGPDGAAVRMAGTVQDVTEQRSAEDKLRESERKFRGLTENLPIGVSLTLEDGTIAEANPALWRTFGFSSKDEFLKCRIQDLYVDPVERRKFVEAVRERGAVKDLEVRVKRKDGTAFTGELTALAQERGDGGMQIVSIFQDITERKRMEAEILKAQKLESVGALAGGIAHDFNNLLLGILGNASIARNHINKEDRAWPMLSDIEKAANRAKNLTRQLLTFSKGGEPVKDLASIGALVRDSASLVLRDSEVVPEFRVPEDLWKVEMDEGQMSQVINNIVLNAAQATEGAGVVEVSAENITVCPGDGLSVEAGDYVRVTIEDHGSGIPELIINRIFDPFFTTKQRASGLGLAVSYSIVRKHGGFIQVESLQGRGASFHIYLPACKESDTAAAAVNAEAIRSSARVLVMDDEELVRDVTGEMLEILGCESDFASDGAEAVRLYRDAATAGSPYTAVILDLTIPGGMGGVDAVKMLKEIDPGVRAIVSSGYSKDPIMSEFRKYGFAGVIAKPYSVSEFSKVVKEVLGGGVRG